MHQLLGLNNIIVRISKIVEVYKSLVAKFNATRLLISINTVLRLMLQLVLGLSVCPGSSLA